MYSKVYIMHIICLKLHKNILKKNGMVKAVTKIINMTLT